MAEFILGGIILIVVTITCIGCIEFIHGFFSSGIKAHNRMRVGFVATVLGGVMLWSLLSVCAKHDIYEEFMEETEMSTK